MKVTLKTLGNKKFDLEGVSPSTTIAELKQRIASDLELGGTVRKLIFKGTSLKKEEQTLEGYKIQEGAEIVCLVKKTPKKKASTPAPEAAEEKEAPSGAAAQDRENYTLKPEDVDQLCKMGYPHQLVELALKAAYGDPAKAAQFLMAGGIPADRAQALHKEMLSLQAQAEQQRRSLGPQGMNAQFEHALSNPEQMAAILSNPQVQKECLRMLAHENRPLYERFAADPDAVGEEEEFQKAMFHILRKSFGAKPAGPTVRRIELTEQDRANLRRLMEEKAVPDMQKAATIYMKFGKDIDKALEFCDQVLAQAREQHPEAARSDATKDAADARARADANRQPLSPRNGDAAEGAQDKGGNPPPKPASGDRENAAPAQPANTMLSISLDMLRDDGDESDEE